VTSPRSAPAELFAAARAGDRVALARLLSAVERGGPEAQVVGRLSFPLSGDAHTIGVTGAPGSGKSSLTNALASVARAGAERLAVLAVDPSSPFTGGAILGDRVRMQEHATDDGVFIRSMASRGNPGGLALATPQAMRVLDAVGWPWIVVETVGVGQAEVAIAGEADTTVVVVNPGWGDAVQANKAGLMETADLFVVNKADRPGASDTRRDILQMLELSDLGGWEPPVVETVAVDGTGCEQLWAEIGRHRRHLHDSGELVERRQRRLANELAGVLQHEIAAEVKARLVNPDMAALHDDVVAGRLDPYQAAQRMLEGILPRHDA
jgi:LAO/AO transport system kinase